MKNALNVVFIQFHWLKGSS